MWTVSDEKVGSDVSHQLLESKIIPDYRRWFYTGVTYFFTIVTYNRRNIFSEELARSFLHQAIADVMALRPFEMQGVVLLPDHCHCIWKMPDDDDNFSGRWHMIKRRFTKSWLANGSRDLPVSASRIKRGERGVWQRRFWEHLIADQQDFARQMDYIHYNPVTFRKELIMKEIPLGNGLNAKVDDEDYEWLSPYSWYAYYDEQRGMTYAAHNTPSGRRVLMHDAIMGLDSLEDEPLN